MSTVNQYVNVPLRGPRLASLFMTFTWGVIGFGVGINSLVKLKDGPRRGGLSVQDVFSTAAVITTVCGLIWLLSAIFLLSLLRTTSQSTYPVSTKYLHVKALLMGFLSVWLVVTLVPFTHFYRIRSVAGFRYRSFHYLRLVAILPWITFLFAVISTIVLIAAYRRKSMTQLYPSYIDHKRAGPAPAPVNNSTREPQPIPGSSVA